MLRFMLSSFYHFSRVSVFFFAYISYIFSFSFLNDMNQKKAYLTRSALRNTAYNRPRGIGAARILSSGTIRCTASSAYRWCNGILARLGCLAFKSIESRSGSCEADEETCEKGLRCILERWLFVWNS